MDTLFFALQIFSWYICGCFSMLFIVALLKSIDDCKRFVLDSEEIGVILILGSLGPFVIPFIIYLAVGAVLVCLIGAGLGKISYLRNFWDRFSELSVKIEFEK